MLHGMAWKTVREGKQLTFFKNSNIKLIAWVITLLTLGPPATPRCDILLADEDRKVLEITLRLMVVHQ